MGLLLVAGGTGTAGRAVVREATARGWDVRSLSRRLPAPEDAAGGVEYVIGDAATGAGLAAALEGVEVFVDVLEGLRGRARRDYALAGRRLLDAARGSGTDRAVSLSIVAADRFPIGFYRAKLAKERVYEEHPLPTTVLRCAQFHDLVAEVFRAGARLGVIPCLRGARLQPIDVRDVAKVLLDAAAEPAGGHLALTACGPEIRAMAELAEAWKHAEGSTARIVEIPVPGRSGRVLAEGGNLVPEAARGTITFEQWLAERHQPVPGA
ncbi:SDR family oxidoreductase [Sinomonas mesophila]|uniref:SDR family oxidoreductase n=1 Tax=Sinomonas mesophila TaxID=1531955 RepID=UPI000984458A|nr:NAD(P)H-binding protein [Sinomonas mesophila]